MTLWTVLTDVSMMAGLLLLGQLLRAKLKIFQKLLIPPALIAGIFALVLGPNGWGILPFSKSLSTYASVLIVIVFAAMPIGDKPSKEAKSGPAIGGMFFNITGVAVLQYAVGMFLTVYVLDLFFKNLNPGFGLMMATGFYGGHGTAAAVGQTYESLGWDEASALGYTTATVGLVGGIISGVAIINWGARKGYTHYVTSPKDLPLSMKTGLVQPMDQQASTKATISTICMDPMAFHLGLVLVPSLFGYMLSKALIPVIGVEIPAFCTALLFGFIVNAVMNKTHSDKYIDRGSISRISGTSTDFLMVSGIGSLQLGIVVKYAVPLIVVCAAGFLTNWLWFHIVGKHSSPKDWFERNMMVWGHACGVAATGVMLQRICDPELKSRGIEDSGISDLINRPIIVGLQVIPPVLMTTMAAAGPHIVTWVCFAIVAVMGIVAYACKWWNPKSKVQTYSQSDVGKVEKMPISRNDQGKAA
ncbi:sodium/glutamate symporter [Caproicibacterium sp. BJN0003]|uniref:sodium/glutamate symporter n=1 Tax=Caproicibacterium sp. BJN0003 TaxID=2994078 RepID=UPI002253B21E|nr:sodium/glutamate symporter [Caproicibacterium sp. BJN0003]UZT82099.1 sodium:glutamate symporter [Caproicibacterium sp. BJN0003]